MTQQEFDLALEAIRINGEARKASLKELKMLEKQRKDENLRTLHRLQEDLTLNSKNIMEYERKIQVVNKQMSEEKMKLRLANPSLESSSNHRWEPYAFKGIAEALFNKYLANEGLNRSIYITWDVIDGVPHYKINNTPKEQ